jgi:hypothetical protein
MKLIESRLTHFTSRLYPVLFYCFFSELMIVAPFLEKLADRAELEKKTVNMAYCDFRSE